MTEENIKKETSEIENHRHAAETDLKQAMHIYESVRIDTTGYFFSKFYIAKLEKIVGKWSNAHVHLLQQQLQIIIFFIKM